ncbi:hypothetical protein CI610_00726 [invertebrate metagenome]|uniref:Uncharacterized protein n=1 Tax=invertebrate metagenome TaxID=1711999 RepID=A0A2H9TAT5_9ZZZZ
MATDGMSARKWLAGHGHQVSFDRIQEIRDKLAKKIDVLDETDPRYEGILEALDVMDQYIIQSSAQQTIGQDCPLDSSSLIPELSGDDSSPLDAAEKRRRFDVLLKTGRY